MDDLEENFWTKPINYHSFYDMKICGYVNMACLAIGFLPTLFTIIVLGSEKMISPMNTILYHLVMTEILAGIAYIPHTWQEYFRVEKCSIAEHRTFLWETIAFHSYIVTFLFHHTSVWLALMLAIWRYIAVLHPLKERHWCNMEITRKWILVGYFAMIVVSIPPYVAIGTGPSIKLLDRNGCSTSNYTVGKNITIYEFKIFVDNDRTLFSLLVAYGVFLKILPSIVFVVISIRLIVSLNEEKERRKKMFSTKRNITYNTKIKIRISEQTDQATKLLLMIVALFLIGELPHGLYSGLSLHYGSKFFWTYYYYAAEISNSITHITGLFNFSIYYSMNSQFRKTFKDLFLRTKKEGRSSEKSVQSLNTSLIDIPIPSRAPGDIKINFNQ